MLVASVTLMVSSSHGQGTPAPRVNPPPDAVNAAQTPSAVPLSRPEQQKSGHDRLDLFDASKAPPSSTAFENQPDKGQILGFDFYRDPLNAKQPMQMFEEIMQADIAQKSQVMATQRQLLERRYNLTPQVDSQVTMARGKPVPVGPTAKLPQGVSWEQLASMPPADIRQRGFFPYAPLPHPKQTPGGQVFPQMQTAMFPRLERFDVEFDLPEAFLPEFPPAIFLQNRPELGDVSRGEVVSINNYYRLFKDLLTPVQLDGLRMLLTPFPQEEFNPTDDRKSAQPSLGVTCFDCHVNGHTTGQFHLNPDDRPEQRRFRLDTVSLRGLFNQQIHGSKRSLRSVEDFTQFEQRTAYFNGDHVSAQRKGVNLPDRFDQVPMMAQMQNIIDFPPAPKLDPTGRLDPTKATQQELAGEEVFLGKGRCGECHIPQTSFLDNNMHDLKLERFYEIGQTVNGLVMLPDGPIKTLTLRGIKDSPPYLHDGRLLTLADTVEFFNLVLGLKLTQQEKDALVVYMQTL
jgi:cytochrome c peroxidase